MTKKTISDAISNISTRYIEEAADYSAKIKTSKRVWFKFGIFVAGLCIVWILALAVPVLTPTSPDDEGVTESVADYPAMIMVDGRLYLDTGEVIDLPVSARQDGEIVSSCDAVPTENNQSNFGKIGSGYRYGEDNTIYVQFDDEWHVFILKGSESDRQDWDTLTEQEKMEIDPTYHAAP